MRAGPPEASLAPSQLKPFFFTATFRLSLWHVPAMAAAAAANIPMFFSRDLRAPLLASFDFLYLVGNYWLGEMVGCRIPSQ